MKWPQIMSKSNSGTKSAQEIEELEKELETEAENATDEQPSEDDEEEEEEDKSKHANDDDEDESDDSDEDDEEDEGDEDEDDEESDDEDDTEDDEDDEEDNDDDQNANKKGNKKIPAWMVKMNERRVSKAIKDAQAKASKDFEEKNGRKPNANEKKELDSDLAKDFEEEFGVAPDENTVKFLKFLEKRTGLNPETKERLAKIEKDALARAEEIGFEQDFSSQKKLINKLFPEASEKVINRIKAKVKELAYTEKYSKYSLDDIIRLNRKSLAPVPRTKTGEPSKGGKGMARYTADNIDPENIDWESMSNEEAEKVMNALEKKQGNLSRVKIFRKGKKVN